MCVGEGGGGRGGLVACVCFGGGGCGGLQDHLVVTGVGGWFGGGSDGMCFGGGGVWSARVCMCVFPGHGACACVHVQVPWFNLLELN